MTAAVLERTDALLSDIRLKEENTQAARTRRSQSEGLYGFRP